MGLLKSGWQPPKSASAIAAERDPPPKHTIPSVGHEAHVVRCTLPGGTLCLCPVPECSGDNVRSSLAATLRVPVGALSAYALLIVDGPLSPKGGVELWDESDPLPLSFFKPVQRRWRRWVWPSLLLRRLHAPAHEDREPTTQYALELLDSDQVLEDLRRGNYPLELLLLATSSLSSSPPPPLAAAAALESGAASASAVAIEIALPGAGSPATISTSPPWLDFVRLALRLALGAPDPTVHAARPARRALPKLLPWLNQHGRRRRFRWAGAETEGGLAASLMPRFLELHASLESSVRESAGIDGAKPLAAWAASAAAAASAVAPASVFCATAASASAVHFRGHWFGPLPAQPALSARLALLAAARASLPRVAIPTVVEEGGGGHGASVGTRDSRTVDFAACHHFSGARLGGAQCSVAIGPDGIVLLFQSEPLHQELKHAAASAATASAATASAATASAATASAATASAAAASTAAAAPSSEQRIEQLVRVGAARLPWESVVEWRCLGPVGSPGPTALELLLTGDVASPLRRLAGGQTIGRGARVQKRGAAEHPGGPARAQATTMTALRLATAQATMIACVLRARAAAPAPVPVPEQCAALVPQASPQPLPRVSSPQPSPRVSSPRGLPPSDPSTQDPARARAPSTPMEEVAITRI